MPKDGKVPDSFILTRILETAQQNQGLLSEIVTNQELLLEQQRKQDRWQTIKLWITVLKYIAIAYFLVWSFLRMTDFIENIVGMMPVPGGYSLDSGKGGMPKFDPKMLESIKSMMDNDTLESFRKYFE